MFRKIILALIVAIGIAVIASFSIDRLRYSHQEIKTCFDDARALRAGNAVRIAGVEVGAVRSVRASTQNQYCPAEVEMDLATTYDIKIPRDSITDIGQEGILGPVFVDIDVRQATGPPIEAYGYLRSKRRAVADSAAADAVVDRLKVLDLMLKRLDASIATNTGSPTANTPHPSDTRQNQKKP